MKKIMWMLLLLYAGVVNAVEIKVCNVGADPWFPERYKQIDPKVESVLKLKHPLIVDSLNSKGKQSGSCWLLPGELIVVRFGFDTTISHPFATREEKMKLAWIVRCGNPIVKPFKITVTVPQKAEVVSVAPPTKPKSLFAGVDTNFNKTKFVPNPKEEEVVEEAPRETQVVRYVIVAPRRQYHSPSYSYGAPAFIPSPQYVRSDYYMSPNIRYPEPPPYVPPPQHVTGPSFVTGPVTSGPGFTTGPATSGPGFTTGGATSGPGFATH